MRKMKKSSVGWIGNIPQNWKLNKIGYIYEERNEKTSEKKHMPLSVTQNGIVPRLEKVVKGENSNCRKLVKRNDFVINSRSDRRGACGISELDGSVSMINLVLRPKQNVNNLFFSYVFKSDMFANEFYRYGNGIVNDLWSTKWSDMKQIYVPCPSVKTQQLIAEFLDHQCKLINSVMELQEEQIIKLQEYRQTVITETVSKGYDHTVSYKDSGVDWIGRIPENWQLIRLKFCTELRNKKWISKSRKRSYIGLENIESHTGKYIETDNNYDLTNALICQPGDVIFAKLRPYLAKAFEVKKKACCSSEFVVFGNFTGNSAYLKYVCLSDWFVKIVDASTYGTKMPRASTDFIRNMQIPMPEPGEQKEIAEYLDSICLRIDKEVNNRNRLLDRLSSYKKSLIYEAVTGKVDIPEQ